MSMRQMHFSMLMRLLALLLSLGSLPLAAATPAVQTASCAVLPFAAQPGSVVEPELLAALTDHYTYQLRHAIDGRVPSREQTDARLASARLAPVSDPIDLTRAVAGGRALGTEQVVVGQVSPNADGYLLETQLIDCHTRRAIRQAGTRARPGTLAADLCRVNLRQLFALPDRPAAGLRAAAAPAAPASRLDTTLLDPTLRLLHERLVVGLRSSSATLDAPRRNYFLGSINYLAVDDARYTELHAQFYPIPWLGIGLGSDKIRAQTYTDSTDSHVDGTVCAAGPILEFYGRARLDEIISCFDPALAARQPWTTRVTPYLGLGFAVLSGDFDPALWWDQGYPTEAEWIRMGRPNDAGRAGTRQIDVGDDVGTVLTLGVAVAVYHGLAIDLNLRNVHATLDATHRYPHNTIRSTGSFDLSHTRVGLGLHYAF